MNNEQKRISKQKTLHRKLDYDRALRVVEHNGNPSILGKSPVEPIESYVYADRDEYAVFLSFVFKNLSEKALVGLDLRIDFYYYQNIPYFSLCFSYCKEDLSLGIISRGDKKLGFKKSCLRDRVESGECFGEKVLIPITDIAYTRIKTVLVSAELEGGERVDIDLAMNGRARRISELDRASRSTFEKGDISPHLRKLHPASNLPQFGSASWLCCCGNKNPSRLEKCEKCRRDRESQKALLSGEVIEAQKERIVSDPTAIIYHDKSKYRQNKFLENERDLRKKNDMIEQALKNVAKQNGTKAQCGVVFKIVYWFIGMMVVSLVLAIAYSIYMILRDSYGDEGNFMKFIQKLLDGDFFIRLGDIWPG